MKTLSKKYRIIRFVIFIIFLGICGFLIGESLTPSKSSAAQSNKVGNIIAGFVNDFNGDQATIIEPTSVEITNKINVAHPEEKLQMNLVTFPEDTRYKSYQFESSNELVASVDSEGNISFLSEGEVTITAKNSYNNEIKDSFTVTVSNILVEELTLSIPNATIEDDIYTLFVGETYQIKTEVAPKNATNSIVEFHVLDNPYLSLVEGQISVSSSSGDELIVIHGLIDTIDEEIKIKTIEKPVENIIVEAMSLSLVSGYINTSVSLSSKVHFTPSNATNKQIEIVSIEDTNIASVKSGVIIKLKSVGETNVTIRHISTGITATAKIKVLERPELEDFDIKITGDSILEGNQTKINIYNVSPKNASTSDVTYSSSDDSVLTVSNKGYVKGISFGVAKIYVTIQGITKELEIIVKTKEEDTTDFVIDYKVKEIPEVLVGNSIKLKDYFSVSEFIPSEPTSSTIEFGILSGKASITNGNLVCLDEGEVQIIMLHKSSGISKIVKVKGIYELKTTKDFTDTIYLNHEAIINLDTNSLYPVNCEASNENAKVIVENDKIRIIPSKIGSIKITLYPTLGSESIDSMKQEFIFNISHKNTSSMNIKFNITKVNGEEVSVDNPDKLDFIKNDKITYSVSLDDDITRESMIVNSTNEAVIKIINSKITLVGAGECTLIFKEVYSTITYRVSCKVFNKVLLNEKKSISVSGKYSFDEESNTITIVNGESITIKYNFLKNTTIRETKYKSSNEGVATIGEDGVLTPISVGNTTITLTIEDENGVLVTNEFNVTVSQKDIIQNLNDFLFKVRKSLGHFGVFLVLAVFASLSLFMYFPNHKWYHILIKVVTIFAFGFGFGAFTEYLQTLTPGRCGTMSDILIDFTGYSIGSGILCIIFITLLVIKHIKMKKNRESE